MIEQPDLPATDEVPLPIVFWRLFENEFATLDGIAISARLIDGMEYTDESDALGRLLGTDDASRPFVPGDASTYELHRALYASMPDVQSVVSGWSRHLRALQMEGLALPAATSMMRKRGITDLSEHLVEPADLIGSRLAETLDAAQRTATRNGMAHLLLVVSNGSVVVAAPSRIEAMAHWHKVEFAARVECMRVEEADVHRVGG